MSKYLTSKDAHEISLRARQLHIPIVGIQDGSRGITGVLVLDKAGSSHLITRINDLEQYKP